LAGGRDVRPGQRQMDVLVPGRGLHWCDDRLPSLGQTRCSYAAAAERFLTKALGGENHPAPRVINTDKHAAYPPAIVELKAERPGVRECGGCEGRSTAPLHSRSVRGDDLNFRSSPRPSVRLQSCNTSVSFINAQANKSGYFGNPNNGQNKGEPYAFLSFYADPSNPGLTFDRIVFSSANRGSGFEMDNQTLATIYTDISGSDIDPTTPIDLGHDPNSNDTIGLRGQTLH
jgi:hypothetical protein